MTCWKVGDRVRVELGDGLHRRGLVATVSEEEETADVLLDTEPPSLASLSLPESAGASSQLVNGEKKGDEDQEEWKEQVPFQSLLPLKPFELEESEETSPQQSRTNASILGGKELRDYISARWLLFNAAKRLISGKLSVGSTAVVFSPSFNENGLLEMQTATIGMVSMFSEENDSAELLLDDDEELIVPRSKLVAIPGDSQRAMDFVRLLHDMAKLALTQKPSCNSSAVESTSVGIHICETLMDQSSQVFSQRTESDLTSEVEECLFQLLLLKTRAHVLQQKFNAAATDIRRAVLMRPGDTKARQLVSIIKQRKAVCEKQNKALAKSVSRWVNQSMRQAHESQLTPNQQQQQQQQQLEDEQRGVERRQDGEEENASGLFGWVRSTFLG